MSILKELQKEKNKRQVANPVSDQEVQGLLQQSYDQSQKIYGIVGLKDKEFEKKLDDKGKIITEIRLAEKWGNTDLVHIDDIKKVCIDYNLRFLQAEYYRGTLETGISIKIEKFCKENNLDIEKLYRHDFYIMAREEDFNLKEAPNPPKNPDPVLFYKVGKDVYKSIVKWGNDLTPIRRLFSWKRKNPDTMFLHYTVTVGMILYAFLTILAPIFSHAELFNWVRFGFSLTVGLLTGMSIAVTAQTQDKDRRVRATCVASWNSVYERYKFLIG